MIKEVIGFALIIIGIIGGILNTSLCQSLCSICSTEQLSPCFFLFLFVEVILVVDGAILVITRNLGNKNKEIKKVPVKKKKR